MHQSNPTWFERISIAAMVILASMILHADTSNSFSSAPDLNPVKFDMKPEHPPVEIVNNGVATAVIVVSKAKTKEIQDTWREAATELRSYIKKCTGAELKIIKESEYTPNTAKARNVILIGSGRISSSKGINANNLKKEGFRITTFDNGVAIVGRDTGILPEKGYRYSNFGEQGTLWGVYDFIERFLGVRWYWPGKLGMSIPESKNLIINPISFHDAPVFQRREYAPNKGNFLRHLRMGRSTRVRTICHTPHYWERQYAKTHPEYFSLKKGGARNFGMRCYSSPATFKQFMADLKDFDKTGANPAWGMWHVPDKFIVPISPMDAGVDCVCERCAKLRRDDSSPASNILGAFVAKLANEVNRLWPGRKVVFLPYANYLLPPDNVKFPDNVEIVYCNTRSLPNYKETELRDFDQRAMETWSKFLGGRKIGTWQYPCWPDDCTKAPFLYPHIIKAFFLKNRDLIDGAFLNGSSPDEWPHQHLVIYPWMKILWNPEFNVDASYDEYCERMYGAAAPEMREILTLLTDRWEKVKWKETPPYHNISPSQVYDETYPPSVVTKIKKLYKVAQSKLRSGSLAQKRLKFTGGVLEQFIKESKRFHDISSGNGDMPVLSVQKVDSNPVLDGKLTDACWGDAPVVNFVNANDRENATPDYPTTAQAVWSTDGITFGFRMSENHPLQLTAKTKARDGSVWFDDCVEIFIDTEAKRKSYAQFVINSIGTVFDGCSRRIDNIANFAKWNCEGVKTRSHIGDDYWSMEVFLPYRGLKTPPPTVGSIWFGNLTRTKNTLPKSLQRFSTTYEGTNHNVMAFSTMRFIAGRTFKSDSHTKLLAHMDGLEKGFFLRDSSGNGNALKLEGGFVTNEGRFGKGLKFLGKGCALTEVFCKETSNWTIECWAKWNGNSDKDQYLFYNGAPGVTGYGVYLRKENDFRLSVMFGGCNAYTSTKKLIINRWTHVALCGDDKTTKLFIDGKEVFLVPNAKPIKPNEARWFSVSLDAGMANRPFNGIIDEVRFSDINRYGSEK